MNKKLDNKTLELKKRKKEQFLTNALKKDTFNGRRYLGTSKFGKDIWIIMRFNKEDMQKIKFDEDVTTATYSKKSFIYNFLFSLRQKIDDPLGKKRIKN